MPAASFCIFLQTFRRPAPVIIQQLPHNCRAAPRHDAARSIQSNTKLVQNHGHPVQWPRLGSARTQRLLRRLQRQDTRRLGHLCCYPGAVLCQRRLGSWGPGLAPNTHTWSFGKPFGTRSVMAKSQPTRGTPVQGASTDNTKPTTSKQDRHVPPVPPIAKPPSAK